MLKISITILLIIGLSACGKDSKQSSQIAGNKAEIINMNADEDGDGLRNGLELKRGLDRHEFNRPLIELSKERFLIGQNFQTTDLIISDRPIVSHDLIPHGIDDLSYQDITLPQLTIKERWLIEKKAKEDKLLQVVLEADLDWTLSEDFEFSYLNVGLGIYQWSTRKVIPLDTQLNVNLLNRGKIRWSFNLSLEDKRKILNQQMNWDFILTIKDSQWNVGKVSIDWNKIKYNYIHFFNQKLNSAQVLTLDISPQRLLPTSRDQQLYREQEAILGLPIPELGQVYFIQEKGLNLKEWDSKVLRMKHTSQHVQLAKMEKEKNKTWRRFDLFINSPEISKVNKSKLVNVVWFGQKPCDGGRFSKKLCEGQSLSMQCQAYYEEAVKNPIKVQFSLNEILVELEGKTILLDEWMRLSGAALLEEDHLLRWEGELAKIKNLIPKSFQWKKEMKTFSLGYIGMSCPSTPANSTQRNDFDQSRYTLEENWSFEMSQFDY